MDRAAPVRSSHTSTADLLAWPQPQGQGQGPAPATPPPPRRPGQVALPVFAVLLLHSLSPRVAASSPWPAALD